MAADGVNGPRWLAPHEQQVWRAWLDVSRLLNERLNRQLIDDNDLSLAEYDILVHLSEHPDRALRMSELATRVVNSRSRLTHTVARMEERGLVERSPCPEDGRGVRCTLTDAGHATIVAAAAGHVEAVRSSMFDPLTETDVAGLGKALEQIRDQLRG